MDSPIRWAGSKRRLRKLLTEKIIASGKSQYIEPFCGSANVFFFHEPQFAILSDRNEWLIRTLIAVRDRPNSVASIVSKLEIDKNTYNRVRSIHHQDRDCDTAAAHFLYLNRLCFNGIFRTNKFGLFNVPFSGQKTGQMVDQRQLQAASAALANAYICHGDFDEVIRQKTNSDAIVYLDPPFATNNSRVFYQYNYNTFGVEDIVRLESVVNHINAIGGSFVLSYADVPEIEYLKSRWKFEIVSVQRNVAGFAGNRRESSEVVISNF
jgi:DNA adenine methylase